MVHIAPTHHYLLVEFMDAQFARWSFMAQLTEEKVKAQVAKMVMML
jgi:hypothetical protein